MRIEVLGPGCPKCDLLVQRTREAVRELGVDATVEKVTDLATMVRYGVMVTPALVVDGSVRLMGRVPSTREITGLLGLEYILAASRSGDNKWFPIKANS